jgi:hypothetical protein
MAENVECNPMQPRQGRPCRLIERRTALERNPEQVGHDLVDHIWRGSSRDVPSNRIHVPIEN